MTNTVLTSGWALSHPITWVFHVAHWEEIGSPEWGLASDSGQCGRPISRMRQRLRSATTRSAARQWAAWLSPITATVSRALAAASP